MSLLIRIGIVAHTSRRDHAKQLQETVQADYLSIDNGTLGCEGNHHHVLSHLAALPSSYVVIIEDDAEPVPNFRQQLELALPMAPAPIVSGYLGKKRPPHWQQAIRKALTQSGDHNWLISTHLLHAVCYAIRTDLLPSLLAHTSNQPSDQHITHWARTYGHTVAYTLPSLCDHLDLPTTTDHPDGQPRTPGRTAWVVGSRQQWTTAALALK